MGAGQKNILVIKLSALGDFIQSLGLMRAIRDHHPNDHITLLTTKPYVQMGRDCGYFDEVLCDERPKLLQPMKWVSLAKTLNNGHFSRVYDLQHNDRTALYFRLMHPKPEWVGTAKNASHLDLEARKKQGRAFDRLRKTLSLAGITNPSIDALAWMKSEYDIGSIPKPYVLIVPGASPQHPEKKWPAHHYAALCALLAEKGFTPVLIGAQAEIELGEQIVASTPACLNLIYKTKLYDLPALARAASGAIGNDTGPMHLIGPTGCKTLALFGPTTDPKRHAPLGQNVNSLQVTDLDALTPERVLEAFMAPADPAASSGA